MVEKHSYSSRNKSTHIHTRTQRHKQNTYAQTQTDNYKNNKFGVKFIKEVDYILRFVTHTPSHIYNIAIFQA